MSGVTIRPACSNWPRYNRQIRQVVASMTDEELALRPSPERWPIWATVGHAACQRVSWLCDLAGSKPVDVSSKRHSLGCLMGRTLDPQTG
ncbi:MAG: DinB family protein [Acidimicrobiia bacterium]